MYKCKFFQVYELIPKSVYEDRGEKAWELLDDRLLITLDNLRKRFGKTIVNDWYWGKDRQWSGLRTPESPYYSKYSQHTFGRAADCLFEKYSAEEIREIILKNPQDPDFVYIKGLELDVSWLHIDIRNCERIKTFTV